MRYRTAHQADTSSTTQADRWTSEAWWERAEDYRIKDEYLFAAGASTRYLLNQDDRTMLASFTKVDSETDSIEWCKEWGLPRNETVFSTVSGSYRTKDGVVAVDPNAPQARAKVENIIREARELAFLTLVQRYLVSEDLFALGSVMAVWTGESRFSLDWLKATHSQNERERMRVSKQKQITPEGPHVFVAFLANTGFPALKQESQVWKRDRSLAVREAAMLFMARQINVHLHNMPQQIEVIQESNGLAFSPRLSISDPLETMYLSLFQELTGVQDYRTCPHPKCLTRFPVTRKDKETCGKKTCQNWWTNQKKLKGGRA